MMINFYDTSSVQALVDAKQEQFYSEVYQRQLALQARPAEEPTPSLVRRSVGRALIRTGAWISGACVQEVPRIQRAA